MAKICRQCGAILADDAAFCGKCGLSTQPKEGTVTPQNRACKTCGQPLGADEKFCGCCGTPTSGESSPVKSQPVNFQPERTAYGQPSYQRPQQDDSDKTKVIALAIGCGIVVLVVLLLLFVFKDNLFGKNDKKENNVSIEETVALSETETAHTDLAAEETEEETAETETIAADMDGVQNRSCGAEGILYYTENMEAPLLILKEPVSVYVYSTSGEKVFYEAVSNIYFGNNSMSNENLLLYNNVEVEVMGSLWARDDLVYMDVDELYGQSKEKETETEKSDDYIIPDSTSRVLTKADVKNLTLKEINYAKNEIYARHGRKFDSKELREYFNSKSWYHGTVDPEDFSESVFNSYEKKNIQFLAQREESMQKGGYKLDQ